MMVWQPIETAPKDGTTIDVWVMPEGAARMAGTYDKGWRATDAWWKGAGYEPGWWADHLGTEGEPEALHCVGEPTHWMPIPEAPDA